MKLLLFNNHRKILSNTFQLYQRLYSNKPLKPPWDVLFFGTDNFSLESLKTLHNECQKSNQLIRKLEVVTTVKNSYVKKYAEEHKISINSWPLATPIEVCAQFHVGVVVSFGNLIPKGVIESFPLGMINVHASLLPRWRGAAPIIHALAAGDEKTGVTIMRIRPHKFDIGEIIQQEEIAIGSDMRMPELHDLLAKIGAKNLLKVLGSAPDIIQNARVQNSQEATLAPRVNSSMANINFSQHTAKDLYNLSRALTGLLPLLTNFNGKSVKLHNVVSYTYTNVGVDRSCEVGSVIYNKNAKVLQIRTKDGWILVDKISVPGKKIMSALEFRNGYLKNTDCQILFTNVVKAP